MLQNNSGDSSFSKPLIVSIIIQLAAILLSATHIRLWATAPRATEILALDELLIVQFLISSLLFPFLCRTLQSTVAIILASFPMIALVSLLAGTGDSTCIACWLNLSIWLLGLHCCVALMRSLGAKMIAVIMISSLNITGIVMYYLAAEMGAIGRAGFIPLMAGLDMTKLPRWPTFVPAIAWLTCTALMHKIFRTRLSTIFVHRKALNFQSIL